MLKVALIGNLAGNASRWAKFLRRRGVEAELYLTDDEAAREGEAAADPWVRVDARTLTCAWAPRGARPMMRFVSPARRGQDVLRRLLSCDLVHSFTGSLFYSPAAVWAFGVRRLRPYVACATGSDLREAALSGGLDGMRMRWFFRGAARTLLLNFDMVALTPRLGLANAEFFPFLVDTAAYCPAPAERAYAPADHLLVFMPSRLDWGLTDRAPGRNSTKGNDRFLRAFARYVHDGGRAHAVLLDRGPDRLLARALVDRLGIGRHVTFLPALDREALVQHYRMADVVADQFDIGAFGTIALEAMACGAPVLIALNERCADQCYPERPPVLQASTEEEILQQIRRAADPAYRQAVGQRARAWVLRHHDGDRLADRLVQLYETVAGSS